MSRTILRIAPLVLTIVAQVLQPVSAPPDAREKAVALVERGLSLGDNSEAEAELYRKAVATDPTYAAAYFNLGFVLQKQARFKEAIDAYRGCIRYDPSRAVAYLNLSTVLEHVHGESAMLEVRSLLNRYVELIEKRERLSQARDRILAIERRLAELSNVEVKEMHEADEIVEQLTRGFRRGDSPYAGPRIPMLIQFEFDSARIRPESEPQLRQVADALRRSRLSEATVMIEGHTDSVGTELYNEELSLRRARAVRDHLVSRLGVNAGRLLTSGKGEVKPIRGNDTEKNRAVNRRVEFVNWAPWQSVVRDVRENPTRSGNDVLYFDEIQR